MKIYLVFLLVSLSTLIPYGEGSVAFEYYVLNVQWPGSFCRLNNCLEPKPSVFTLHGLWPSNLTTEVSNCKTNFKFPDSTTIKNWPIANKLDRYWPSLSMDNITFWQSQWRKHGSCSTLDPLDYFTRALDLYNQFEVANLLPSLQQHSVVPVEASGYTPAQVEQALEDTVGLGKYVIYIKCRWATVGKKKRDSLLEIEIYMDPNFKPISSPKKSTCDSKGTYFPPV